MESKEEKIEESPPKTKTQENLQKVPPTLETALDMEEASIIDLCIQKTTFNPNRQQVVAIYLHPMSEEINEPPKGEERVSYIFRGISVADLRGRVETALEKIKCLSYKKMGEEVFQYHYPFESKIKIYGFAELLNRDWYLTG